MFKNYWKTALRNLRRSKIYSGINILGLSLGLACVLLIILYVKDEVSYDRFHQQGEQLYRVNMQSSDPDGTVRQKGGYTGYFPGPRFAATIPEIKGYVRLQNDQKDIRTGADIRSQMVMVADPNFFTVFSFPLMEGQPAHVLENPYSVVLSESMARREFGTTAAVGRTIEVKGDDNKFIRYEVTGVAKDAPQNSSIHFDMVFPLIVGKDQMEQNDNWINFFLTTFVVLEPGASTAHVESLMKKVYETEAAPAIKMVADRFNDHSVIRYSLQPLVNVHLDTTYQAGSGISGSSNPTYSYILSGIALFILLIACINFINLTMARSLRRAKEIGIRKVIGSTRQQLIGQFLGESFILCGIAFLLALLLAQMVLPAFNQLANKNLSLGYLADVRLIGAYAALFLATGLLAGFYPALVLSGWNPVKTLYSRFNMTGKNYLQKSLVVLQFALASFLIVGTITIYTQFNYLSQKDKGYDDQHLLAVDLPWREVTRDKSAKVRDELAKIPPATGIAFKNGGSWVTHAHVMGNKDIKFALETVDEDYLPLLKVPFLKGRNFSRQFPADPTKSIVVNEAFVKDAGWKDPIGQEVDFFYNPGEKYTVVGVIKDYHYEALTTTIAPQMFMMKPGNSYGRVFLKIMPGQETAALQQVTKSFKSLFPFSPFVYHFKDEENAKAYEAEARWKNIMMMGAVLTIFISCIGLFGLSVLSAEKRTREIGIRKVLGASVQGVVAMLSKDYIRLVWLALLIALPLARMAAGKWLENYPYRINMSWWMFAIAAGLVTFIALFTISFNAIRAARVNPASSLKVN